MIRLRFLFAVWICLVFASSFGFHIQPKVVNGDLSNIGDFPFYVLLEKNGRPICGGSIISNRYVRPSVHTSNSLYGHVMVPVHVSFLSITCKPHFLGLRWILTAAHCISREKDIHTHLGVVHVTEPEFELLACLGIDSLGQCKMTVNVPSSNQYIDPLHDRTTKMHDLGEAC